MLTARPKRFGGESEASLQVCAFEIGKFREQIFEAVATSQVLQHRFDRIAQSAHDRFSVADFGIDHNTGKQRIHADKLPLSHAGSQDTFALGQKSCKKPGWEAMCLIDSRSPAREGFRSGVHWRYDLGYFTLGLDRGTSLYLHWVLRAALTSVILWSWRWAWQKSSMRFKRCRAQSAGRFWNGRVRCSGRRSPKVSNKGCAKSLPVKSWNWMRLWEN